MRMSLSTDRICELVVVSAARDPVSRRCGRILQDRVLLASRMLPKPDKELTYEEVKRLIEASFPLPSDESLNSSTNID